MATFERVLFIQNRQPPLKKNRLLLNFYKMLGNEHEIAVKSARHAKIKTISKL